jgi:hypothetical protein
VAGGVRSRAGAVLALGAALVLAACETPGRSAPEASGATASGPPPPGSEGTPSAPPDPAEAREQTAALVVPPVLDDDPQQLIGLGPERLEALLGEPGLIRREGDAAIWQYRDGTCVLDLFLYEDGAGPAVTYVEARGQDATKTETRPCLNAVLHRRLVAVSAATAAAKAAGSGTSHAP